MIGYGRRIYSISPAVPFNFSYCFFSSFELQMWCTEKQEDDDFNDASSMDNHIAGKDFRIVR